jgi:hypothetical protein
MLRRIHATDYPIVATAVLEWLSRYPENEGLDESKILAGLKDDVKRVDQEHLVFEENGAVEGYLILKKLSNGYELSGGRINQEASKSIYAKVVSEVCRYIERKRVPAKLTITVWLQHRRLRVIGYLLKRSGFVDDGKDDQHVYFSKWLCKKQNG